MKLPVAQMSAMPAMVGLRVLGIPLIRAESRAPPTFGLNGVHGGHGAEDDLPNIPEVGPVLWLTPLIGLPEPGAPRPANRSRRSYATRHR